MWAIVLFWLATIAGVIGMRKEEPEAFYPYTVCTVLIAIAVTAREWRKKNRERENKIQFYYDDPTAVLGKVTNKTTNKEGALIVTVKNSEEGKEYIDSITKSTQKSFPDDISTSE